MKRLSVAEANRVYFDENAKTYDADEACIVDDRAQRIVAGHLVRLVARLNSAFPQGQLRALDAGGGSGNISLKLLGLGVSTTLVDVSQEMIGLYMSKLDDVMIAQSKTTCSNIESFLLSSDDKYHLICFSSVLHHLADYESVLDLAIAHLHAGGIIYTIHDPCMKTPFWNRLDLADHHRSSPSRFGAYIRRKVGGSRDVSAAIEKLQGPHPEPHLEPGIDDLALRRHFEDSGLSVLWHERYQTAITWPVTLLYRLSGRARGFSFAIQVRI